MTDLRDQLQHTLGDSYTIEHELRGGGMSRVFVATETRLQRKVVVKVLPADLAAAVNLERFRREIQLAAKLQHPNIVPVLTAGETEGLPYYTMPFVQGESLRHRIDRDGPLKIPDVVRILSDLLSALAFAHEQGVVHRDIKPDNVLLTGRVAQVTDFGIAKALTAAAQPGSFVTSLGVALGTPAYMAPEQAVADPSIDHRADLYATGAVTYEMLTGSQLFSSRSPQAMMAAQAIEKPEPIEKRRESVPAALSDLVMQSLEKDADKRPQSADEMLSKLEAAQISSATVGAHQGKSEPRKRTFAIVAVIALLIAAIAIGSIRLWQRTSRVEAQPRLAVLPFENGGNSEDAYFVDGMTEAITNRLASISGMTVLGRSSAKRFAGSAMSPQQIGREMGVSYLLTGSVRWDKSQPDKSVVSIRPALVRVADGVQIWSEPYDAVLANEFKLQSDVAERVARALDVRLLPHETRDLSKPPTTDPQAYDDYLRGRFLWNKRTAVGLREAAVHFRNAIARDSTFARAYSGLADVYLALPLYAGGDPQETGKLAQSNAEKAIALDSTLGAPHAARATLLATENKWAEAEKEFKRAIELEPRYATAYQWYSRLLLTLGRLDEARRVAAQARSLEPLSSIINASLGIVELCSGDYRHATSTLAFSVSLDPANPVSRLQKSIGLLHTGEYSTAIAELDTASRSSDNPRADIYESARAYALAKAGDTTAARQILRRIKNLPEPTQSGVALVHAGLHEDDSAAVWLAKYVRAGGEMVDMRWPLFDSIRSDPRVTQAMRETFAQH